MSFTKRTLLLIGLLLVVVGGTCLIVAHLHATHMSYSSKPARYLATTTALVVPTASISPQTTVLATSTAAKSSVVPVPPMTFEVVTSDAAQQQGLGGRAIIPDNYAMLFVFANDGSPGFWMKDMLTSIDMIWVSDNGTIVSINPSVAADTYPAVFYPAQPIKYVLETRAGFAAEKGWTVGTHVSLPAPYN